MFFFESRLQNGVILFLLKTLKEESQVIEQELSSFYGYFFREWLIKMKPFNVAQIMIQQRSLTDNDWILNEISISADQSNSVCSSSTVL